VFYVAQHRDQLFIESLQTGDEKFACELRDLGSNMWQGMCRWQQLVNCPGAINFCKLEQPYQLRVVTADRIEGTIQMPTFECGKGCTPIAAESRAVILTPKK
jgi:hypothetical protein